MLQLYRLKRLLDLSYYKDLGCFVINLLNNKTTVLLNLAEYRLILADSAYGLVAKYQTIFRAISQDNC